MTVAINDWLTVKEAAVFIGVSPGRIRQLLVEERFGEDAMPVNGKAWVIKKRAVKAYKDSDRSPGRKKI